MRARQVLTEIFKSGVQIIVGAVGVFCVFASIMIASSFLDGFASIGIVPIVSISILIGFVVSVSCVISARCALIDKPKRGIIFGAISSSVLGTGIAICLPHQPLHPIFKSNPAFSFGVGVVGSMLLYGAIGLFICLFVSSFIKNRG